MALGTLQESKEKTQGLLRPRLRINTVSLLSHSVGQGQPNSRNEENDCPLRGVTTESKAKGTGGRIVATIPLLVTLMENCDAILLYEYKEKASPISSKKGYISQEICRVSGSYFRARKQPICDSHYRCSRHSGPPSGHTVGLHAPACLKFGRLM